jgi:DNA-directed RNA polymerase specialized sigma24 family protein
VKIFRKNRTGAPPAAVYATAADFCRIFKDDMNRLYQLSLLLTAAPGLAEKCFVRGLDTSQDSNSVFKEWAASWARRAIIVNAIRIIGPRPNVVSARTTREIDGLPEELAAVIDLKPFDRFVFVMSVLEGYPDRDCRLLLGCTNSDIAQARTRALEQLGALAERRDLNHNRLQIQLKAAESETTHATTIRPHWALSA